MKYLKQAAVLWGVILVTTSCSSNLQEPHSAVEVSALSQSLFESGTNVSDSQGLMILNSSQGFISDGGTIAGPSQTGSSGEGGSIGAPSNSGGTGDSGSSTSNTVTQPVAPSSGTTDTGSGSAGESSTSSSGQSNQGVASNGGSTSNSDSGTLFPPTSSSEGDTGGISPLPGSSSGDQGGLNSGSTNVADNGGTSGGSSSSGSESGSSSTTSPSNGDSGTVGSGGGTNVADNGGVTPGTSTGGDSGSVGGSTSGTGDSGSSGGTSTPGGDGGTGPKPPCGGTPKPPEFKVSLNRVCSIRRSNSKALFFEEAKNPILSIEALSNSNADSQSQTSFLASMGFAKIPYGTNTATIKSSKGTIALSVASLKLKGVDLIKEKFSSKLNVGIGFLQKQLGMSWGMAYLNVRVCDDTNNDGFCFDEAQSRQLAYEVPVFKASAVPKSFNVGVWSGRYLTVAKNPLQCEIQYSPLVFDLRGNGLRLVGPDSGIQFDLNDTGTAIPTGWIGRGDDALLVRDLNKNGDIESGAELFGNATKLLNGDRAENGFEALKQLDSDGDGQITSKDSAWSELRFWVDSNQDGVSQRRELFNLSRLGTESISLNYVKLLEVDSHGNQTRERSTFVRKVLGKRHTLVVSDVWFNTY